MFYICIVIGKVMLIVLDVNFSELYVVNLRIFLV